MSTCTWATVNWPVVLYVRVEIYPRGLCIGRWHYSSYIYAVCAFDFAGWLIHLEPIREVLMSQAVKEDRTQSRASAVLVTREVFWEGGLPNLSMTR